MSCVGADVLGGTATLAVKEAVRIRRKGQLECAIKGFAIPMTVNQARSMAVSNCMRFLPRVN
jgi:hypothetical protein